MSLVTPRKGYKSVPWMFGKEIEIPQEWEVKRVGSISKIKGGKRLPKGEPFSKDKTNHPYLRVTDFGNNTIYEKNLEYVTDDIFKKIKNYTISSEDVYISIAGTIGLAGLIPKSLDGASLTENACKIIVTKKIIKEYLSIILNSKLIQDQIQSYLGVTSQPKLALFRIEKLEFPLPPLPEQQKISTILSNIDSLIDSTSKVIENSKQVKTGLMQKLLTRGIGHVIFKKVPWLFGKKIEIPQEWEIKRLDEIGEIIGGGTPDSTNKDYWDGEILWAVPTDITKLQINQIENTERKITKLGLKNSSAKLLPIETILITSRATVGECAITTKPISTNQGFQNIICNDRHHNYLIFYLIEQFTNNLLRLSHGTTFLEISKNQIKKVIIPVSNSLPEQQKIASILSNIDSKIDSQEQYKEKLQKLKKSLMQKLLTGEVRV